MSTFIRRTCFILMLTLELAAVLFMISIPLWGSWLHLFLTGKPMGF